MRTSLVDEPASKAQLKVELEPSLKLRMPVPAMAAFVSGSRLMKAETAFSSVFGLM